MPAPTDAARLAARTRPDRSPVLRQRWQRLLFLHWAWDPAAVQRTLPAGLTVDTFEGRAWLGVVPLLMRDVRPAYCPPVPGISNFLGLNVRTYVYDAQGRPGVWFYSLDANQWLAVELARAWYHLPYRHAAMSATVEDDGTVSLAARRQDQERESGFRYRPAGRGREEKPGSLEFFLVERYRLFAQDARRGWLYTARVAHAPYRVGAAQVTAWDDTMLQLAGFDPAARRPVPRTRDPDHICAAGGVEVEVFAPERVGEPAAVLEAAAGTLGEGAMPA